MGVATLDPSDDAVLPLPLTLEELARSLDAIGGFERRPTIGVAVSGGPDSMALMLLVDRWARDRGGRAWGLTVDHGLRPESSAEAAQVGAWLAARRIPHEVLAWIGPKPASGIQDAARGARYRLLAGWCRARSCLHLLTAHHREDQAETYLIRRRAGSGSDGLAGMAAVRELEGCRLVRPLLAVPRARLAALLGAERQPYLRDPSNLDPRFERARLRMNLDPSPPFRGEREGPGAESRESEEGARGCSGIPRLTPTLSAPEGGKRDEQEAFDDAHAFGRQRIARERALDALIGRAVVLHPAGFAVLEPAALTAADDELAERLLARVAAHIGGARYPARRARVSRLGQCLATAPGRARTLGGCRFVPWRGRLLILRELAAASPPASLVPGAELLWDGRFAVSVPRQLSGVTIGYLGQLGLRPPLRENGDLPRLVHGVLPAFRDAKGLASVPHLHYRREDFTRLPLISPRPVNPLTRAGFTVV